MVGVRFSPYELPSRDRKERKPVIEKMRRERMNTSISQLKDLISDTIKRNAAPMSRVDKADILEYAVIHLQELKQRLQTTSGSPRDKATQNYDVGFKDCAKEAVTFLTRTQQADDNIATEVSNHLYTVYMARRRQPTGSKTPRTSGPCLSTPVRCHNMALDSRLSTQLSQECSPIHRYNKTNNQQDMTSPRIPEIDACLGDLSFNTVMSVLNFTDSSNSDASVMSKHSSSADNDSFYSSKSSKMLRYSSENVSHDMSLGTVASVVDEMSASDDSEDNTDDVYVDVVSNVQAEGVVDSDSVGKFSKVSVPEVVSACVWRPW